MKHPLRAIGTITLLAIVVLFAWTGVVNATPAPTVDASADCTAMTVTATNQANQPVVVTLDGGPPTAVAPGATHRWTVGYGRHTVAWTYDNGATGSKAVSHHNPPDCPTDTPTTTSPPALSVPPSAPPAAPPANTPDAPLVSAPGAPSELPATGSGINWLAAFAASLILAGTLMRLAGVRRP